MPATLPALSPITLGTLEIAVLERLGDTGAVYWSATEIDGNIKEALRVWNAATRFWRTRVTFNTVANQAIYDLSSVLAANLGYTVTDRQLVSSMQTHLLEPPTPTAWTGTAMFALTDLTQALQRRRDQFLVETGAVLTAYTPPIAPNSSGRTQLQDSIIDIRRASWISTAGYYTPLWRDDELAYAAFSPTWTASTDTPFSYSVSLTPPFAIQFAPPPQATGDVDLLVVNAGAELNPATPVAMGIPDDFCWAVMWGALGDLLGENGPAYDPARAQYCDQRWQGGIDMAETAATVMQALLNGVPLGVVTLAEQDAFFPTWQNSPGPPASIAMAALNILVVSPPPDGVYSITVDIVQNAPMPVIAGDQILIGRDAADVIVDYAQHISAFKQNGEEFFVTGTLFERFNKLAEIYRKRTGAQTRDHKALQNRGRLQLKEIPMKLVTVK